MARDLVPGDVVHCQGIVATIKEIAWQEPWEWRESYYLEFKDTNGVYRSWKQKYDGGHAELISCANCKHKYEYGGDDKYGNEYHIPCTTWEMAEGEDEEIAPCCEGFERK